MNAFFVAYLEAAAFHLVCLFFFLRILARNPAARGVRWSATAVFVLLAGLAVAQAAAAVQHPVFVAGTAIASVITGFGFFCVLARLIKPDVLKSGEHSFDQLKDEFLSLASHELRTPLSVINGFAEILVRERLGPLNQEQKRRVRKILMQGQRLNRIVDELLDLSRIRSGKVEVRRDIFDLVPILKACLDDHQIVCDQQQIALVDRIPDTLPDVEGDLERVTQVVVNLLNNAIKYTQPGGSITVSAARDGAAPEVKVEVRDTGIGIEPQDHPRLFREFSRVNNEYARKFSGSGLGLAIVKQLVEAQGGRVGVVSEGRGKGSCFFFTLREAVPLAAKPGNGKKTAA